MAALATELDRWHLCCGPCRRGGHRDGCPDCQGRTAATFGDPHPDDYRGRARVTGAFYGRDFDDEGNVLETADPMPDEPKTELGYAKRLIPVYGDRLRYVPAWSRWLVWDGKRWAHDTTGQAARWMKVIARRVTDDALAIEDDRRRRAALQRRPPRRILGRRPRRAHPRRHRAGIVVTPDDLDADPFLLNCANGTLDLRTGELHAHDPADLLTKMTGAAYRPALTDPSSRSSWSASSPTRRCAPTSPGSSAMP